MKSTKPDFDALNWEQFSCSGMGNHIVMPNLIATIKLREPTEEEEKKRRAENEKAKEIYETYINKGSKFRAKGGNKIECRITFINEAKRSITWKQYNMSEEYANLGYKPAQGQWWINAIINMVVQDKIEFLP